jgi:catechol 2,3-dioxygenase-like lactoylglutathione lyase family enzyme
MLSTADVVGMVPVTDVARARAFYEGVLGLRALSADDYGCMLESNGTTVRLSRVDDFERPAFTILGWSVASIEDAVRALAAAGVACHRYDGMGQDEAGIWTAPSQDRVAWFSDSEGNTLSVIQSVSQAVTQSA